MDSDRIRVEIITERKIIVVRPGMLNGSRDQIEVDVCVKCGAVVFDPVAHDIWHRGFDGRARELSS